MLPARKRLPVSNYEKMKAFNGYVQARSHGEILDILQIICYIYLDSISNVRTYTRYVMYRCFCGIHRDTLHIMCTCLNIGITWLGRYISARYHRFPAVDSTVTTVLLHDVRACRGLNWAYSHKQYQRIAPMVGLMAVLVGVSLLQSCLVQHKYIRTAWYPHRLKC